MLHSGEEFRCVAGGNGRAKNLGLGRDRAAWQARVATVERVVNLSRTRAKAGGAVITSEPKVSDYGDDYWVDRSYECRDLGGHHWWFTQRLRTRGQDV